MSLLKEKKLGFIGAGNMAEAIFRGLISTDTVKAENVILFDIREDRLQELKQELGVQTTTSVKDLLAGAECIVLAVKPQNLSDLSAELKGKSRQNQIFFSILAGIKAKRLERALLHPNNMQPRVVRAMPNTPALVGLGVTGISAGTNASENDMALAEELFSAIGIVEQVESHMMDAVTGLTGSGPAYFFKVIEGLIDAGIAQGLPPEMSARMVKQLALGSAKMAAESEFDPGELRRRVTSPNGTTAAGLEVMDQGNISELMKAVVKAATDRSIELSEEQ